jgi:hypothetical protein
MSVSNLNYYTCSAHQAKVPAGCQKNIIKYHIGVKAQTLNCDTNKLQILHEIARVRIFTLIRFVPHTNVHTTFL